MRIVVLVETTMANKMSTEFSLATASLRSLGFSEYEARAYIALVRHSPLNGYALAKEAGVPRPNIYPVVTKLVERGAALALQAPGGTRYAAVAPRQLIEQLGSAHEKLLRSTVTSLESLGTSPDVENIFNVRGYSALLEHAASAIRKATSHLLIALWPDESKLLEVELRNAEDRNVSITILCMYACGNDCGACHGAVYRYRTTPNQEKRWLIVVADGKSMIAGEVEGGDAQAVITDQRLLTELSGAYIRHSIALATLLDDLGPKIDESLSPRSREVLNALSPQTQSGSFTDYMHQLMSDE